MRINRIRKEGEQQFVCHARINGKSAVFYTRTREGARREGFDWLKLRKRRLKEAAA